jgi:hypothetical protein
MRRVYCAPSGKGFDSPAYLHRKSDLKHRIARFDRAGDTTIESDRVERASRHALDTFGERPLFACRHLFPLVAPADIPV